MIFVVILWPIFIAVFVLLFCLVSAGLLAWLERRPIELFDGRVIHNQNGKSFSVLSVMFWWTGCSRIVADIVKLFTKEDIINVRVHRVLHDVAPLVTLVSILLAFAVIPLGPDTTVLGTRLSLQILRLDVGFLYVIVMSSLSVFGLVLAGYGSGSRWTRLGGLQIARQMVSYELIVVSSLLGLPVVFSTFEPYALVEQQGYLIGGWLPMWGVFVQPLGFYILLLSISAGIKRFPSDFGSNTGSLCCLEYSGMKFGMFYIAGYIEILVLAGLLTTLFFGGWQVPYLVDINETGSVTLNSQMSNAQGILLPKMASPVIISSTLAFSLRVASFCMKMAFFCWLQLLYRRALPRLRPDQITKLGWRRLLPLSMCNLVATTAVVLWVTNY